MATPSLSTRFAEPTITRVKMTFDTLEKWLSSSLLGGAVIYAKRKHKVQQNENPA